MTARSGGEGSPGDPGDPPETPAPPPRLPLAKKVVFAFIPLVVFVVLVEGVCRLVPRPASARRTQSGLVVPDPDLIWRLRPRFTGSATTNELGFRDTPYNSRAERKVLILGDSVSWGDGIMDVNDVYPQVLERLLSRDDGKTCEVVNSSVPGYSTFQELRYLEIRGLALEPDLIVLQFCLNDVVERYVSLAQYGGEAQFLGIDTRQSIQGVFGWLVRNSRAFELLTRLLVRRSRNQQAYEVEALASDALSPELKTAWDTVLSEVEGIRRAALAHGIPLMIVVTPYRFQLDRPQATDQPQRVLATYAHAHDVPFFDLLPAFSAFHRENPSVPLFNDENHFSVEGHALTAAVLSKEIERLFASGDSGASRGSGTASDSGSGRCSELRCSRSDPELRRQPQRPR